jgi:hypothetical protein
MFWGQDARLPFVALPFDVVTVGLLIGVCALYLLINALRFNAYTFPKAYARWQDSYHCYRCNRVSIIQRVD